MSGAVQTGLDILIDQGWPSLRGKRVGLVTNPSGVDARLRSGAELLAAAGDFQLVALFGPEHGIWGEAQAGEHVAATRDPRTGLPIYSLYGETRRPTREMMQGLDALIVDIQDVGVRYATYLSTLALVQEAAAEVGVGLLVLDRPNPLNGMRVEGNILDPVFASFVGAHTIPVRHGLTMGEFARLYASERGLPLPEVIPMRGWLPGQWYDETGLPWVQPSPNLPSLQAITLYPGTCLLEGTNISEGRGTTRPFEVFSAPWIDPFTLVDALRALALDGVAFRPMFFTPTFSKHAGAVCGGVQIHVLQRESLQAVDLGLGILQALGALFPKEFSWRLNPEGYHFIDYLMGTDQVRRGLDRGLQLADLQAGWDIDLTRFSERCQSSLLYPR